VFGSFYAFFRVLNLWIGNRVSPAAEAEGLDVAEMGAVGYPDFAIAPDFHSASRTGPKTPFRAIS
jgi:hypothetical protein